MFGPALIDTRRHHMLVNGQLQIKIIFCIFKNTKGEIDRPGLKINLRRYINKYRAFNKAVKAG